ncbi:MAG: DNA methyltransferase [Ignavibacteriaceae bacterium]
MSLFQKSVVNKYLKNLNQQTVEEAYKQFQQFYDDAERIENIRLLKEENYQEGFLREIFVDVLGYTINPNKNYNLTTEYKNETDSKKADGAILKDGKAIGVIELKSTKTPDLESIRDQAFNYKNNQTNCKYVITSNFEKLRFYIDNATDWEEFNLFHLDYNNFCKLYLFLSKESIFNGITAKLKDESKIHEEDITGKLYKDYSVFKQQLFVDLTKHNPSTDKLLLFHKSQKLLDRILFILFAEDRGLLPPNAISRIIEQWEKLKELDEEKSLYSRFVKLFHHLDEGHKYKEYELPAYNGGLFKKDDVLDKLIISDSILHKNSVSLSKYDYNTEVDVNVLGHIFENSITEIEQVKAEIEGTQSDKNRSRRKKEGIFYTPKYITKYIVDNTVGALCAEKKKELGIVEIENEIIENSRTSKGKLTKKAGALLQKLNEYRDYLTSLKILDPACGSGAFLNQALEYLINEHELVDSYRRELEQDSLGLYDITKSILENNLYGVDINEEAVEIAKLSLWIRTAEKGRKLSDLSKNIKCGNSLIDDPAIAGDKAFDWDKEFPEIINNGGFDVVIGNPPYVRGDKLIPMKDYLSQNYDCYASSADLYSYFYEKGLKLLNEKGILGFISSNKFVKSNYGVNLRKVLSKYQFIQLIDFGELPVFSDASTFPMILIIRNTFLNNHFIHLQVSDLEFSSLEELIKNQSASISQVLIKNDNWNFSAKEEIGITAKMNVSAKTLSDYLDGQIKFGIKTGLNEAFIIEEKVYKEIVADNIDNSVVLKKFLDGDDVRKYHYNYRNKYLIFFPKGWTKLNYGIGLNQENSFRKISQQFPKIFEHLNKHKDKAIKRSDMGDYWWELRACDYYSDFEKPKIIYPDIALEPRFTIDTEGYFPNATLFEIPKNDLFLLSVLNSKLIWYYLTKICPVIGDVNKRGRLRLKTIYIKNLPIKVIESKELFELKAKEMLRLYESFHSKQEIFLSRIESNFTIDKLSNKLKEFYNYDFKTFLSELKKKKITLTLKQQDEWEQYFNEYKTEINKLQQQISQTDKEIDQHVYKLYGLTEEEIKIVEESIK